MTKLKIGNRKNNKQQNLIRKKFIFTFISLLFIYLFGSFAVCLMLFFVELPQTSIYYVVLISVIVFALLGGLLTGKIHIKNGLLNSVVYNLPFILVILAVSFILNDFTLDYRALITLVLMLLSAAVGGVIGVNTSRKKR